MEEETKVARKRNAKGHFVPAEATESAPEEKETLTAVIDERIAANVTIKNLPRIIRHPDIRAGRCEFCDAHWKACMCSRGNYHSMDVACTFCRNKDMTNYRKLEVFSLQESPNIYIFVCSDQKCIKQCANQFLNRK